tara:strand:+ start:161 stop:427 length:267 start_codon:yes stop_codon:yes gene_type:complete
MSDEDTRTGFIDVCGTTTLLVVVSFVFGWSIGAGATGVWVGLLIFFVIALIAVAVFWYRKHRKSSTSDKKSEKKGWFSGYAGGLPQLP